MINISDTENHEENIRMTGFGETLSFKESVNRA